MYVDNTNVSNKEYFETLSDFSMCTVCTGIVIEPVQCNKCENCFCKNCINQWCKNCKSCPMKCVSPEFKEPSRLIKNMLSKLIFDCPIKCCDSKIPYDDLLIHEVKCGSETVNCPLCCSKINKKTLAGKKEYAEMKLELEILKKDYSKLQADYEDVKSKIGKDSLSESKIDNNFNNKKNRKFKPGLTHNHLPRQKRVYTNDPNNDVLEINSLLAKSGIIDNNQSKWINNSDNNYNNQVKNSDNNYNNQVKNSDNNYNNQVKNSNNNYNNQFNNSNNKYNNQVNNSNQEYSLVSINGGIFRNSLVSSNWLDSNNKDVVGDCAHAKCSFTMSFACCPEQVFNCKVCHDNVAQCVKRLKILTSYCKNCKNAIHQKLKNCPFCKYSMFADYFKNKSKRIQFNESNVNDESGFKGSKVSKDQNNSRGNKIRK